ncbi:glycosyltransferase family 2 protein [Dapis sp. BLCC M172]|uniref:glycosyltransferase family 2 protein n=1 Tax=Dapis sp. BLCC M172 TaxID=2975281 RepID=UPI003CF3322E
MTQPILSIIVPTREGLPEYWIESLLKINGDVELILVHPPGMKKLPISDPRMQQINSSFRGEIIQRMTGLMNASAQYILTVNCDELLHPDIAEITRQYFTKFPDSWVLRLNRKDVTYGDEAGLKSPWETVSNIDEMKTCGVSTGDQNLQDQPNYMVEIPIAPLHNKFDPFCMLRGRKDHHGRHTENFDKKVWKNEMVQATLADIRDAMILSGPFKYFPFWCLDRLLGLSIQAKYYEQGKIIGHILPKPEQIRIEDNPPEYRRTKRFYVFAELLLLKNNPQYGYLWNLILAQFADIPVRAISSINRRLSENKMQKITNG